MDFHSRIPRLAAALLVATLTGCGTISAMGKLENGAGTEASRMWDRWVQADGDIAVATTWERKVKAGVTGDDIEQILRSVATERNMKEVASTAREMVDFSPHMAAYLPCRVSVVEKEDGLWRYTLYMDMMVKMGRKLPSPLKDNAWAVRSTIFEMTERASRGEF